MKFKLSPNRHLQLKQTLYHLALISFVVVIIWIGFEIYFSYTKRQTSKQTLTLKQKVEPITANLYEDVAAELSEKTNIPSSEIEAFKPTLHQLMLDKQSQAKLGEDAPISFQPSPATTSASPSPTPASAVPDNPFTNPNP